MSYQEMKASVERLPTQAPKFDTERCLVVPLGPDKARELLAVLLQDELLAAQLPWMVEKTADGARKEAFLIGMQCAAETTLVWGIVERARGAYIGAVIARSAIGGWTWRCCAPRSSGTRALPTRPAGPSPSGWKSTPPSNWCRRAEAGLSIRRRNRRGKAAASPARRDGPQWAAHSSCRAALAGFARAGRLVTGAVRNAADAAGTLRGLPARARARA